MQQVLTRTVTEQETTVAAHGVAVAALVAASAPLPARSMKRRRSMQANGACGALWIAVTQPSLMKPSCEDLCGTRLGHGQLQPENAPLEQGRSGPQQRAH